MSNPYVGLPDKAYWRTGVAGRSHLELQDLYSKRFDIKHTDSVATAGSCFAQHIGRQMMERGFGFADYEPAPSYMDAETASRFGYNMYSARFGNVYTVRQLRQLFLRAFGEYEPLEDCWEKEGRFYDPFRPSIEPKGFASAEEMRSVRSGHLASVRNMFATADIFVFTLGLTEAWISKKDGAAFPTCPGTVAGTFDADAHEFHSFTYPEIIEDLNYVISRMRKKNPTVKFVLTVSPVPLTATATSNHIISANSYSKSVLRAVAGDLYAQHEFVDYFPSYEIIAATSARAMFYEPNMRSVSASGVRHVMSYFFGQHQSSSSATLNLKPKKLKSESEVICDEEKLDAAALSEK